MYRSFMKNMLLIVTPVTFQNMKERAKPHLAQHTQSCTRRGNTEFSVEKAASRRVRSAITPTLFCVIHKDDSQKHNAMS